MKFCTLLPLLIYSIASFSFDNIKADTDATASVENSADTAAAVPTKEAATAKQDEPAAEDKPAADDPPKEAKDGIEKQSAKKEPPTQSGPLIDLLGSNLLSLEMVDETQAKIAQNLTTDALAGKKVIGLYFSADWCGPCRQFTPELVSFYNKMNSRRGHKDQFQIVWVSRCRDVNSFGQYFTHMPWLALPPEEAMGKRGESLSNKYKVKGIPSLVLLDDMGSVITTDARNKIPKDKAGIGFPWRNPLVTLYTTLVPRSLRMMVKNKVGLAKSSAVSKIKSMVGLNRASATKV